MVIWVGLQAKLDKGWKWANCGIDWLKWKMIVSLKKIVCEINLFCKHSWSYKIKQ